MLVLIARPNIFSGGSDVDRFYRHVIRQHLGVHFIVLQETTDVGQDTIPPNVEVVSFRKQAGRCLVPHDSSRVDEALARSAYDIAANLRGRRFDIVDTSSTDPIAHLLYGALDLFDVTTKLMAIGLHGWPSDAAANEFDQAIPAATIAALARHEALALEAADIRYAFSPMWVDDARKRGSRPVMSVDTVDALDNAAITPSWSGGAIFDPEDSSASHALIENLATDYDARRASPNASRRELPARTDFLLRAYNAPANSDLSAKAVGRKLFQTIRFAETKFLPRPSELMQWNLPVHMVLTIDDAAAVITAVAISSIAARASSSRAYVATIIHFPLTLSEASKDLIVAAAGARLKIAFHAVELPASLTPVQSYWPHIAYVKLLLPAIPDLGPRVIYLDADIVVLADIAELFDQDLREFALGAFRDEVITEMPRAGWPSTLDAIQGDNGRYFRHQLELSEAALKTYFPSNVLVMDLDRMRADGVFEKACAFFERKGRMLRYADQDILNYVFQGAYCQLDPRWNVWSKFGASPSDDRGAAILHFANPDRPWIDPNTPGGAVFWREADQSPVSAAARALEADQSPISAVARELLEQNVGTTKPHALASVSYGDPDSMGRWLRPNEARACFAVSGFSMDEIEGTWIVGNPAVFYLPVASLPGTVKLSIEGYTLAAAPGQTVTFSVGTENISKSVAERDSHIELVCTVPQESRLIGGKFLEVKLAFSPFVVPMEQGWSHDIRLLRFFVRRIMFETSFDLALE